MCRVLEVSPSGYYAWRKRPVSDRECGDAALKERIVKIFTTSRGRYGAPRVHQALRRNGIRIARKRVARLMRQCSLRARTPCRRVRTTDSNHRHSVARNLLDRQFTASAAHQKWTSDITYIATHEGWLYLAVVIDLFSRRVVGWSMSQQIDEVLVRQAIAMALSGKPTNCDLLLHSDQGSQYAATGIGQLDLPRYSRHRSTGVSFPRRYVMAAQKI
ncbi:MAG: Mobile element protein [Chlorobi bacterium]|nr:Mobile element protein [Chlorobiota bacterium]